LQATAAAAFAVSASGDNCVSLQQEEKMSLLSADIVFSGVNKREGAGGPAPPFQSFRQNINIRLNCMTFGNSVSLFWGKIVATRSHILKTKCIKFNFGWNSASDPIDRVYSAPQTL